ncbi:hypothetical protein FWH13_03920 [Candidatus Saccharibacteria bacterium]|nr:hypothetical protein [Candidatus Saccharibacteria bacterium]
MSAKRNLLFPIIIGAGVITALAAMLFFIIYLSSGADRNTLATTSVTCTHGLVNAEDSIHWTFVYTFDASGETFRHLHVETIMRSRTRDPAYEDSLRQECSRANDSAGILCRVTVGQESTIMSESFDIPELAADTLPGILYFDDPATITLDYLKQQSQDPNVNISCRF